MSVVVEGGHFVAVGRQAACRKARFLRRFGRFPLNVPLMIYVIFRFAAKNACVNDDLIVKKITKSVDFRPVVK